MKVLFVVMLVFSLSVFAGLNWYLFIRGRQALEILERRFRILYAIVFWTMPALFFGSMMLETAAGSGALTDTVFLIGSFWVAVMLYGFLFVVIVDIVRLIGKLFKIKPKIVFQNYVATKAIVLVAFLALLSVIFVVGYKNATRPQATHLTIELNKQGGNLSQLRVAMVSDIHLGYIYRQRELARIVDVINEQQPDIVMLVGDIFEGPPEPVIKNDMGVEFARLQTKYGVYFATGNHEYMGANNSPDAALNYLATHGVKPLVDAVALIDSAFYVVGRKDPSGGARKDLTELLHDIDRNLPIILLDHQPFNLDEAVDAKIDLQLSGHTHNGQMYPLNYIVNLIFEKSWGFLKKGDTNFYVSCGAGTWGPPIRIGSYAEVVMIDLKFR